MMKKILKIIIAVVILCLVLGLQMFFLDNPTVREATASGGYLGVAIFSLLNSFNFIIPIVTPTFMPTWVAAGLDAYITILIIVAVISVIDIAFFLVGRYSAKYASDFVSGKNAKRLRTLRERNPVLPYAFLALWVCFIPFPNELITVTMGILGYKFAPVSGIIIVGNLVYNSFIAYLSLAVVA